MVANKKRISSELLHIALVITLLRGNDNRYFSNRSPVISSNFFNDVGVSNDIMGPSWAYSRTSFHNFYHDPPIYQMKSLGRAMEDPGSIIHDDWDADYSQDDLDIDLNIINQLRSLTISRFNSLTRLGKNEPTFQDITAYLLSESTNPLDPTSIPGVAEFESPTSPEPSDAELALQLLQFGEDTLIPSSPGVDSGHEETGDDGDADNRSTTSETIKELSFDVASPPPPVSVSRNGQRRESHGFHSDSEEEPSNYGSSASQSPNEEEDGVAAAATSEINEVKVKQEKEDEDVKMDVVEEDAEMLFDEWWNDDPLDVTLRVSPSNEIDQTTRELLEHVHRNEVGGAAGITPSAEISQILKEETDYFNLPDLFLEAERSSLEFYKKFNDISESELSNAIAPEDLHEHDDSDSEQPSTSFAIKVEKTDSDVVVKEERDPVVASSSSRSDAAVDEVSYPTPDMISAMFDDILEGDSGVFDFLETSSEPGDIAYDDISENSHDSILAESLHDESAAETEETSFSGEMIQTAPIHAGARPTTHGAQPRGFQVHARMPGLLRGGSMEQRWQDLANLLSLQSSSHDPSGAGLHQPIPHHFPPHPYHPHHHHHHHPHAPTPLHHSMHPPHFGSGVPPTTPYSTDTARSVLLQNATLAPPELNSTYGNVGMGASSNLGSAVASSMHLTNSSEPMIDPSSHYKMMDPSHDMLYYQNSTNEMANQTSGADGFNLSSILNDDELQLMDMAMSEGMYTMWVMENGVSSSNLTTVGAPPNVPHNGTSASCSVMGASGGAASTEDRMEASSDSAVSSMGSERVPPMTDPPMSDNEWVDADSHPHGPHDLSPYSMDYSRGKLGGYDYYKDGSRVPGGPVAQKKHQMFGKRFQQEQSSHPYPLPSHLPYPEPGSASQGSSLDLDKYSCGTDFGRYNGQRSLGSGVVDPLQSNHTYSLPPTHPENPLLKTAKPVQKESKQKKEALTRDEKKARAMSIPITTEDIINLPMDEFNERLSKYDLSESQLSLIRDIRRRGKNKVAAQNCRKRKLDQILQLADEVQRIREKKQALMREQQGLLGRRTELKERYNILCRTVTQALRESDGNPYSPYGYSIQHAADGNVVLVPRNSTQPSTSTTSSENGMSHSNNHHGRRDKSKDESSASQGSSLDLDKYSCGTDFGRYNGQRSLGSGVVDPLQSNHTYSLPPTHPENPLLKTAKPVQKESKQKKEALTRDEKKARAMSIPITTEDIINLPMDEFNERLSKYDLSESQLSLIRDIRRRGKNKVAAQNCRKRKLDQILQLADEVQRIREKKQALMREQQGLLGRRTELKERYNILCRTVTQALRESDGNPYSPYGYSIQHAADGNVVLVPRNSTQPSTSTTSSENGMSHSNNHHGRRDKSKDESKKE